MRIVVTGALGHIGSALIRQLPLYFPDSEFILIDNLSTQRYCSLFNLPKANYKFIEADVRTCKIPECDVAVHLAAYTEPHADLDWQHNYDATENVTKQCERVIFASTMSVLPEPQTAYAAMKLKEESLIHGAILRLGNLFGPSPGMRFHTVVSKFCWQAVNGQPLSIWGNAVYQIKPYVDLIDVCRAIGFFIEHHYSGAYELVTQNERLIDVLYAIQKFIYYMEMSPVDTSITNRSQFGNSDEIRSLGFKFTGDLQRGIRETIAMLRR